MLKHLTIHNYALISQLDIDFQDGFSALTGETGAGKSIILGALSLVMGARADTQSITEGEDHCVIEADFGQYLIRRELNRNGRSRTFVNDEIVTQQELKNLSAQLIDIHSQHANLLIENDDFQLSIVDAIAQNSKQRESYLTVYEQYRAAEKELHDLIALADKTRNDADYIAFQYQQLADANLQSDELDELEQEQYRLTHAEDIKRNLQEVLAKLDDEQGASSLIHSCHVDTVSDELEERLQSVDIELRDIIAELNNRYEQIEFNPERLNEVEERLDILNTLLRKHQVQTVDELISLRDRLAEQVNQIANFDEQIAELQQRFDQTKEQLTDQASALTHSREQVRETICTQLIRSMNALGVAHANVGIAIEPLPDFTPDGIDNVQFLFAANLNQSLRRVSDVASGGEISRLMLCIKALIASTNGLPTIIFDEIDTGVSGEVATQMGKIMRQIASSRQIIVITHLPQIAAQAQTQYRVYKQDTDTRTETHISQLTDTERITEVASMLAGKQQSEATIKTAKELLCCH
ncbi:MAG: DNA repair protein RecN [Paludibacteraceae bacterium]|nr:DNA repair protein RecN [Paludibacteraceae bacterium]